MMTNMMKKQDSQQAKDVSDVEGEDNAANWMLELRM
jgi:hypothetical protein